MNVYDVIWNKMLAHERAHNAVVAAAIAAKSPGLLAAADAIFGCRMRPMLGEDAERYHAGWVHACAAFGIEDEPEGELHEVPLINLSPRYGPRHGCKDPWLREWWQAFDWARSRKGIAVRNDIYREMIAALLEWDACCDDLLGTRWYLLGRTWGELHPLLPYPPPGSKKARDMFVLGRSVTLRDFEYDIIPESEIDRVAALFPIRLAAGPEQALGECQLW